MLFLRARRRGGRFVEVIVLFVIFRFVVFEVDCKGGWERSRCPVVMAVFQFLITGRVCSAVVVLYLAVLVWEVSDWLGFES